MKRIAYIFFIALLSIPVHAKKNIYEGLDIYGIENSNVPKKSNFVFDLGVGKKIELGFHFQKNFNKYFAWDIVSLKYTADWQAGDWAAEEYLFNVSHDLTLTTGVRAFTPSFASKKLKGFVSFGIGYGSAWINCDNYWRYDDETDTEQSNHCAIEMTFGLQFNDKLSIGYGLSSLPGDRSKLGSSLRLGIIF